MTGSRSSMNTVIGIKDRFAGPDGPLPSQ